MSSDSPPLNLPGELRNKLWDMTSAQGVWVGLMPTCRQICQEITHYCTFPDHMDVIDRLVITIDSTYDRGGWLKIECSWTDQGSRTVTRTIQDMEDPWVRRLRRCTIIRKIEIVLVPPKEGDFFDAFLMMFAKASDISNWVQSRDRMHPQRGIHVAKDASEKFPGLKIILQDDSTATTRALEPASRFWTQRIVEDSLDQVRSFALPHWGQRAYYYEYFLCLTWGAVHWRAPTKPEIILPPSIPGHVSTLVDGPWQAVIGSLQDQDLAPDRLRGWDSRRGKAANDFARWVAETHLQRQDLDFGAYLPSYTRDGSVWLSTTMQVFYSMIRSDIHSLRSLLNAYLDQYDGPSGGPMSMLRLHRFKTVSHEYWNIFHWPYDYKDKWNGCGSLERQRHITLHLLQLFDPLALSALVGLKKSCPHFSAVEWPAKPETDRQSPRQRWIVAYPLGISYRVPGQATNRGEDGHEDQVSPTSLVRWRCKLETYKDPDHPADEWVMNTTQCLACCEAAIPVHRELQTPEEEPERPPPACIYCRVSGEEDDCDHLDLPRSSCGDDYDTLLHNEWHELDPFPLDDAFADNSLVISNLTTYTNSFAFLKSLSRNPRADSWRIEYDCMTRHCFSHDYEADFLETEPTERTMNIHSHEESSYWPNW